MTGSRVPEVPEVGGALQRIVRLLSYFFFNHDSGQKTQFSCVKITLSQQQVSPSIFNRLLWRFGSRLRGPSRGAVCLRDSDVKETKISSASHEHSDIPHQPRGGYDAPRSHSTIKCSAQLAPE